MQMPMFPAEIRRGDRFVWHGRTDWVALTDAELERGGMVAVLVQRRGGEKAVRRWDPSQRLLIARSPSEVKERHPSPAPT